MMQELNDAYSKKDLKKIKEILYSLENGIAFDVASDTINDKEHLKEKIKDVRDRINHFNEEIEEIKASETYSIIHEIDDLDEYFDQLKSDLQEELERLHRESEKMDNTPTRTSNTQKPDEEDDYWDIPF